MNNGNCGNNICGLGNNSMIWIIIILLFMPNLFGGCGGCNSGCGSDLLILIVLVCCFMGGNNGLFGIGCGC